MKVYYAMKQSPFDMKWYWALSLISSDDAHDRVDKATTNYAYVNQQDVATGAKITGLAMSKYMADLDCKSAAETFSKRRKIANTKAISGVHEFD